MRLPPLNALRAFEAAARHEGYIAAADELNVSRGAISRHVKLLEAHLGLPLFVRQAQGVRLTAAGRRLAAVLAESFSQIAEEAARLTRDAAELRVLCPPATSIRWLIPRLGRFQQAHPDIHLRLTTDFHFVTEGQREFDISFSVEHWPGRAADMEVLPLFPIRLTPACAPVLLDSAGGLERPDQLSHHPLLHETPRRADWAAWLKAFPVPGLDPASGHEFHNLDMAVRAAVMGAGVVMADLVLCKEELDSGVLIAPFPGLISGTPDGSICLLGKAEQWDSPNVTAFREWVIAEAADVRAALAQSEALAAQHEPL